MKRLLLVGLRYHDYTDAIIAEIERAGYQVVFHDVQPRTCLYKTARILLPSLYRRMLDRHHAAILAAEAGTRYDVVLFIQAHQFSRQNIDALRTQQAGARFVLYNWDAITTHDYRPNMDVFDAVYTFDPDDAKALGVNYLPLFCTRPFQQLDRSRRDVNSVYFVGNIVNVRRYFALRAFRDYCRRENIAFHCHMVCSPYVFLLLLLTGVVPQGVSFVPIRSAALAAMMEQSAAVFDFANHRQAGYTMRLLENLGAGMRIITNNHRIAAEPFFSADRICVFRDLDFSAVRPFLAQRLNQPDRIFEEFHIQTFVRRLLS